MSDLCGASQFPLHDQWPGGRGGSLLQSECVIHTVCNMAPVSLHIGEAMAAAGHVMLYEVRLSLPITSALQNNDTTERTFHRKFLEFIAN